MHKLYTAAIPEPRVILGLRLRPLSLGHIVLLHRVESAFVTGDTVRYEDLALSIFICAVTYREGLQALDDPGLSASMGRWAQKLTRTRPIDRLLRRKPKPIDTIAKIQEFRDYLVEGSWHPEYTASSNDSEPIALPAEQIIRVTLMREMGFSEAEIMDRPWSMCLTDFFTLRALDGAVNLVDGDEIRKMIAEAEQALNGNHA